MTEHLDDNFVRAVVESAGKTLMMLPGHGTRPSGYKSNWPEPKREAIGNVLYDENGNAIGFEEIIPDARQTWPKPNQKQMTEFEMVLDWMIELHSYCNRKQLDYLYGAVQLGMKHHPVTGKRWHSWKAMAKIMGQRDYRTAQKWYGDGIAIITKNRNRLISKCYAQ